jgi:hypothetical protein
MSEQNGQEQPKATPVAVQIVGGIRPSARKPEHRRVLEAAAAKIDAGLKLLDERRHEQALVCFQDGLKVFQQLVNEGHHECVGDVALAQHYVGEVFFYTGKFEECIAANEVAIRLWRDLVASGNLAFADDIGYPLSAKAHALFRLHRFDDALKVVDDSIRALRLALATAPNPTTTRDLATVINLRGHILARLGRIQESAQSCREAAQLRDGVDGGKPRES